MLYVRRISAHLQRQANKIQIRSKSGRDCGWEELGGLLDVINWDDAPPSVGQEK